MLVVVHHATAATNRFSDVWPGPYSTEQIHPGLIKPTGGMSAVGSEDRRVSNLDRCVWTLNSGHPEKPALAADQERPSDSAK